MQKKINEQSGFGILITMIVVSIIAYMGWAILSRVTGGSDPEETTTEIIDSAQNAVDKANDAGEKASSILDKASDAVDSASN